MVVCSGLKFCSNWVNKLRIELTNINLRSSSGYCSCTILTVSLNDDTNDTMCSPPILS